MNALNKSRTVVISLVCAVLFIGCASNQLTLQLDIYRGATNQPPDVMTTTNLIENLKAIDELMAEFTRAMERHTQDNLDNSFSRYSRRLSSEVSDRPYSYPDRNQQPTAATIQNAQFWDDEEPILSEPSISAYVSKNSFYDLLDAAEEYKSNILKYKAIPSYTNYTDFFLSRESFRDAFSKFTNEFKIVPTSQVSIPMIVEYTIPIQRPRQSEIETNIPFSYIVTNTHFRPVNQTTQMVEKFVPASDKPEFEWVTIRQLPTKTIATNQLEILQQIPYMIPVSSNVVQYLTNATTKSTNVYQVKVPQTSLTNRYKTNTYRTVIIQTNAVLLSQTTTNLLATNLLGSTLITKDSLAGYMFTNPVVVTNYETDIVLVTNEVPNQQLVWTWRLVNSSYTGEIETNLVSDINAAAIKTVTDLLDKSQKLAQQEFSEYYLGPGHWRGDLERFQDAADPMWQTISSHSNRTNWNTKFATNYFKAQGNSGVVIVRDSPIHYRIQRANNNPTALVQSQLRISRALTDAAIQMTSAATGVKASPLPGGDGSGTGTNTLPEQEMTTAQRRMELDQRLIIVNRSITEVQAKLSSLLNLTNTTEIQMGLTNILNGAAKRFEK